MHCSQHGFRRKRSVITKMQFFLNQLYNYYDCSENELCVLYFDFRKAFDSVPHRPLINTGIWYWRKRRIFSSYLKNRKQYVKVSELNSESTEVPRGVPQGSLLRSLLFIIYINDLPQQVEQWGPYDYADYYNFVGTDTAKLPADIYRIKKLCREQDDIK